MKKIVSLLLCVIMVVSCMAITTYASTDSSSYVMSNPEDSIAAGALIGARPANNSFFASAYQKYFDGISDVNVVVDENDENNRIFQIAGHSTVNTDNVLNFLVGGDNGMSKWPMRRFSAKFMLDTTIGGHADFFKVTANDWTAAPTSNTFGVRFQNGGAYYRDLSAGVYVPFIPDSTMNAKTWYKVEVIMDNRNAATEGAYMNAFVFDANDQLIGTSGWKKVSQGNSTSYIGAKIQVRGYEEGESVWVDELDVKQITGEPTYTVSAQKYVPNKYIKSPATTSWMALAEYFSTSSKVTVSPETTNKAVRVEFSFRIPEITDKVYSFLIFKGKNAGPSRYNDQEKFWGTVKVEGNALSVYGYNENLTEDDIKIDKLYTVLQNLSNGSTSYTITADRWYKLVWDIDYSLEKPTGMLYVKDGETGELLVQSAAAYPVQPIASYLEGGKVTYTSIIVYSAAKKKGTVHHIDDTFVYAAPTVADLDSASARTTVIYDTFEAYDENTLYIAKNANKANALVNMGVEGTTHLGRGGGDYFDTNACVVADTFAELPLNVEEVLLNGLSELKFNYAFSNPMPVANINTNNIELYADDAKMTSGYTVTPGEIDADNCTTTFTVSVTSLEWGTDYSLRVKGEVADCNTALSGGVPAFTGPYAEIRFATVSNEPQFDTDAALVTADDVSLDDAMLYTGDTVKGKVTFTDNGVSPYSCYVIVALYQGSKLVDIVKSDLITIPPKATEVTAQTPVITVKDDAVSAKLFIWNNFETMKPVIETVVAGE